MAMTYGSLGLAFSAWTLIALPSSTTHAQQSGTISIGAGDLGGVVTSPNGSEAGVWVIAETAELPTKFAKIVATDEAGRYLLPDLPPANYEVWVRGYGLIDSPKVKAAPGRQLDLAATPASNERAAAEY